jgi:hypothetical protein
MTIGYLCEIATHVAMSGFVCQIATTGYIHHIRLTITLTMVDYC